MNGLDTQVRQEVNVEISFASRLKNERIRLRLSQKEMAAEIGIGIKTYSSWELGYREPSTKEVILQGISGLHNGDMPHKRIKSSTSSDRRLGQRILTCLVRIADVLEKIEGKL